MSIVLTLLRYLSTFINNGMINVWRTEYNSSRKTQTFWITDSDSLPWDDKKYVKNTYCFHNLSHWLPPHSNTCNYWRGLYKSRCFDIDLVGSHLYLNSIAKDKNIISKNYTNTNDSVKKLSLNQTFFNKTFRTRYNILLQNLRWDSFKIVSIEILKTQTQKGKPIKINLQKLMEASSKEKLFYNVFKRNAYWV